MNRHFSVGPGVVVWLALSELMPTRIRSTGMGFALLLNQGVATGIAAVFLPTVGNFGYSAMFFFWAGWHPSLNPGWKNRCGGGWCPASWMQSTARS